ncbi:MAG: gamma-glutamyl-gamma-aminobutyrate hydrolase family protein [Myxococcota bacterium]
MRPLIVVTLDQGTVDRRGVSFPTVYAKEAYARAVERAGGLPFLAAPTADLELAAELGGRLDGLVVTGGAFDIEPERYGQTPSGARVDAPKPLRTAFEWKLIEVALARGRPVLGICGGMQLLNVVLGGTLLQDIGTSIAGALEHEQPNSPALPAHAVALSPDSRLARRLGHTSIAVNTTHHQALDRVAETLVVVGRSPDGVIEAVEHRNAPGTLGVQWHPELLQDEASAAIYSTLVEASAG